MAKLDLPLFHAPSLVVLLSLVTTCTATSYIVGDAAGWDISSDLTSWPANKTFYVGDVLWFQYSSYDSVYEVSKDGYSSCSTSNAIMSSANGNTTVPLTSPGDTYFICGVLSYCLGGMRLHVVVLQRTVVAPAGAPLQEPSAPVDPSARKGGGFYLSGAPSGGRGLGLVGWSSTLMVLLWFMSFSL